jgi:hypothetical protein
LQSLDFSYVSQFLMSIRKERKFRSIESCFDIFFNFYCLSSSLIDDS